MADYVPVESNSMLLPPVNPWWQPPRLRNKEAQTDRHPTWLELFFDLVLVAAIGQLDKCLERDLSWHAIGRFIFLAIPIWWAWTGVAFYSTRFDTNDLSDRVFYFLQMLGVAALAVSVPEAFGAYSSGFAVSYAILRLLLVVQYLIATWYIPEARRLTLRYACGFGLAAILFISSVWVETPYRFMIWGVALLVDFGVPMSAGRLHAQVPPHNAHISERYGLFILVVLGEAIFGAVSGVTARSHWNLMSGFSGMLSLLMTFSLWWVYFDHASSAPLRSVIETNRVLLYQVWLYSHLPLMICLSAMGVGIQKLVLAPQFLPLAPNLKLLLCFSVAGSLFVIGVVHAASCYCGVLRTLRIWLPYALVIGAIILLATPVPLQLRPWQWASLLAALCVFNLVIQVFYDRIIYNAPCILSK